MTEIKLKDIIDEATMMDSYIVIRCANSAVRTGIMDNLIKLGLYNRHNNDHAFEENPYIFISYDGDCFFTHVENEGNKCYESEKIWWLV